MALFGFPDLKIEIDASVGGMLTDISAYVTSIGGWSREALLEEITAAGDNDDAWAAVGLLQKSELSMTGPYNSAANSLVALTIGGEGETRTIALTFDGATASDVETCEALIKSISRNPSKGALHAYEVVWRPTGAIS